MTVINGENAILGRLASNIAKRLLKRETIHVVNAEKVVVIGSKILLVEKLHTRMIMSPKGNPEKGPKYSRMPDKIVRRAIRGMLPWKVARGKEAYKILKVHIGVPKELANEKMEVLENVLNKHTSGFTTIGETSRSLGAKF